MFTVDGMREHIVRKEGHRPAACLEHFCRDRVWSTNAASRGAGQCFKDLLGGRLEAMLVDLWRSLRGHRGANAFYDLTSEQLGEVLLPAELGCMCRGGYGTILQLDRTKWFWNVPFEAAHKAVSPFGVTFRTCDRCLMHHALPKGLLVSADHEFGKSLNVLKSPSAPCRLHSRLPSAGLRPDVGCCLGFGSSRRRGRMLPGSVPPGVQRAGKECAPEDFKCAMHSPSGR